MQHTSLHAHERRSLYRFVWVFSPCTDALHIIGTIHCTCYHRPKARSGRCMREFGRLTLRFPKIPNDYWKFGRLTERKGVLLIFCRGWIFFPEPLSERIRPEIVQPGAATDAIRCNGRTMLNRRTQACMMDAYICMHEHARTDTYPAEQDTGTGAAGRRPRRGP